MADSHTEVQNIANKAIMWNGILFQRICLGYIFRLWCFFMKQRDENAYLEHVHELFIKGFADHIGESHLLIVQYFNLMLLYQELYGYTTASLIFHIYDAIVSVYVFVSVAEEKQRLLNLLNLMHILLKIILE